MAARIGSPRRRRLLLAAGLGLLLTAGWFAWGHLQLKHYTIKARQALDAGDPEAALSPLELAAHAHADSAEVEYLLAVVFRRTGQTELFRQHLDRARKLGWPAEDLERQEWLAVVQAGAADAAQDRLKAAVTRGVPDDAAAEIYEAVAQGHLAGCRLSDAWTCLEMWLRWRPEAPQARLMRGSIYEAMGDVAPAVEDYRAAVRALPANVIAKVRLARMLLAQGQTNEAQQQFQECLEIAPGHGDALIGAARCSHELGEDADAHRYLETAIAQELPAAQRAEALAELGRILLDEGKVAESIGALSQAAALKPTEAPIHHRLALALGRAGRTEQAKHHDGLAQAMRAEQKRLIDIRRELLGKPGDADLRYEAGMILIRQGFQAEGVEWLSSAVRAVPHHLKSHQYLARFYAEIGNPAQAAHHRLMAAEAEAEATKAAGGQDSRRPSRKGADE